MKKIIAHYLPQYHAFPENDRWWGDGFTEWTCVNRARSLRPGHRVRRPHPDVGYYCLLDREVRGRQAATARAHGVDGFCYYHYWFGDKVLMDRPLQCMLEDGEPDLPFCLSWANEPWTRRMNGGGGELLQPNNYGGPAEWECHLQYLLRFFRHPNYIRVDGRPMLLVYRVGAIPEYRSRFAYWKRRLRECGLGGLFVVMTVGAASVGCKHPAGGVDAAVDFYPNFFRQPDVTLFEDGPVTFYSMAAAYRRILSDPPCHPTHFKGTMVGFDSSPRNAARANVFLDGSPRLFEGHLAELMAATREDYVFVNAWNEWGEGCALEPEEQDGYGYLEAVRRVTGRLRLKV